jgi:hypothetical protein
MPANPDLNRASVSGASNVKYQPQQVSRLPRLMVSRFPYAPVLWRLPPEFVVIRQAVVNRTLATERA